MHMLIRASQKNQFGPELLPYVAMANTRNLMRVRPESVPNSRCTMTPKFYEADSLHKNEWL